MEMETERVDVDEETLTLVAYSLSKSRNRSIENLLRIEDLYRKLCLRLKVNSTPKSITHLQYMHRSLVTAWSLQRTPDSLDKTLALLEAMCVYNLEPHPSTYTMIAGAWGTECLQRSRSLLNKLIDKGVRGRRLAVAYNLLLASSKRSLEVSSAEDLFESMCEELSPDVVSYNLLLEAIGRSNSKDVVKRCANVLRNMRVPPNDYTLAVMMKLWSSRLPAEKAMEEADQLFQKIKTPSLASYCQLISGWSRLDPKHATSYVDAMLKNWKSLSLTEVTLYSSLIEAVARNHQAQLADKLLRSMMSSNPTLKPDARLICVVLQSWAYSGKKNCGSMANDLLDDAMTMGVALNSEMVGAVLLAWLREGVSTHMGRAESLFRRANREKLQMNFLTLKSMLLIYGRMRDVAQKAEELLNRMQREFPNEVDTVCFNIVMEAWGKSSWRVAGQRAVQLFDTLNETTIKPDVVSYTSLVSALGKDYSESSIDKAEQYFNDMILKGIEPDARSYNTLISVLCKSKSFDRERRVRDVFGRMVNDGRAPSIVTYTAMLSMYSSSKDPYASNYIYEIFERIKRESLSLDAAGYSSLLSAIGKTNDEQAALKADSIFNEMISTGIKPDSTAWNIIISIWTRSVLQQKYERTEELFQSMLEMGCPPNEFVVATLFKLWAFCKNRDYAKKKILNLYEYLLSSNVGLDAFAMKALLQALRRIMPPSIALEKADKLLNRMLDFGLAPEPGCFIACLNFDKAPNAYTRGVRYAIMLRNAGIQPPRELYAAIKSTIERPTTPNTDDSLTVYRRLQSELNQADSV